MWLHRDLSQNSESACLFRTELLLKCLEQFIIPFLMRTNFILYQFSSHHDQ